jgi:uncharacterized repeat protein (TIGR01451 family)
MKKQIFLAVMLSVVCFVDAKAQSWVKNYLRDTSAMYRTSQLMPASDSSYLMIGDFSNTNMRSFTIKVDAKGNELNRHKTYLPPFLRTVYKLANNDFLVMGYDTLYRFETFLLDNNGNFKQRLAVTNLPFKYNIVGLIQFNMTRRNDSIFAICESNNDSVAIIVFNPIKNSIYNKKFIEKRPTTMNIEAIQGGYACIFTLDNSLTVVKTNTEGDVISRKTYPVANLLAAFGGFIKSFKDEQDNLYIMNLTDIYKIGNNGDIIWHRNTLSKILSNNTNDTFTTYNSGFSVLKNGQLMLVQSALKNYFLGAFSGYSLYKISANGDSVWRKQFELPSATADNLSMLPVTIISTNDGGFLIPTTTRLESTVRPQLVKTEARADNFLGRIVGKISRNDNNSCVVSANQFVIANMQLIVTQGDGQTYLGYTDRLGNYTIYCDTGTYTIRPIVIDGLLQFCTPSISGRISTIGISDTVNFTAKTVVNCPMLRVDLSVSGLRRCFNNNFNVNFCNNGTIPATNAYVDIRLDSLVEFISATRPLASQNRNVFRFNLGTIGIGECGYFTINGRVKCGDSTRLGQTLCNEAHIYPDSVCLPTGTFSGANLTVSGSCVGDSVQFIVKNIGTATSQNRRSVVLEDEVLFQFNINGLPPNATFSRKYPANGSTWRMIVEQEPNNSNSQFPTAFVEGCGRNGNGGVSSGFVTTFGNDDATPSVSTLCRQIIGSFDPNDKQGFPTGYKAEHFIRQNQDVDYVIRFQNTGTDTAFLVVVRDTLSDVLDLASIEFGGSSHAYEADIYGKNIVKFTFQNINLPDSFRNVMASQGFVKFRIKQKKDLPIGTKINNKAGIYFDFNDPIITNTTLHTVAKDVLITAIIEPNKTPNSLTINVSPNPFTEHATFELLENDKPFSSNFNALNFQLFDALGRLIRNEKITNARFEFNKNDLANGLYFFKIMNGGKVMGHGKLVVQ